MFETLYRRQFTVRLQRAAAFAEGRSHYLEDLAKRGHAPATIRAAARDILAVAERIKVAPPAKVTIANVGAAVDQWMQVKQRTLPALRIRMVNSAKAWLRFSGLFVEAERSQPFSDEVERFECYMREERGLASQGVPDNGIGFPRSVLRVEAAP